MTWLDVIALILLAVFCGLGARMGSVWVAASLAAGFFGSFLVDYYTLPLAGMMGSFKGSIPASAAILYLAAVAVFITPGLLLSKVEGVLLKVFDGMFGFFTGAMAGFCALFVLLLAVIPKYDNIEKKKFWEESVLVKPLYSFVESSVNNPNFKFQTAGEELKEEALNKLLKK